ncbi:FAD/NAD(P)-binding oxidoreductase [Wolffia australiana]
MAAIAIAGAIPRPLQPSPSSSSSLSPLPMSIFPLLRRSFRRNLPSLAIAAAARQDTIAWTHAPLKLLRPASADGSLFHAQIDVSESPDLAAGFTAPGQYLQIRVPDAPKPAFLAIASPPEAASLKGVFEFLIKKVPGSAAEKLCGLGSGDLVELSGVMGKGFAVDRFSPPESVSTVFIFATGSGISPIRSLIESGFSADKRSDVKLFYGARNLQRMAYQDRFKDWESSGVRIVPVLSQPDDDSWNGQSGYVQEVFSRAKQILNPSSTGAVLCGHNQMMEDVTAMLVADGVSKDKILKNF